MDDRAATLNAAGDQLREPHIGGSPSASQLRAGTMKFIHASGSRPLEGFEIKRGIGAGGFGEVYFATSDAGKEVALKHIQRSLDVELRGVSQCLNLKHPNLVDLYDIRYDESGGGWVVMEYVSGQSLKADIDAHPDGMPQDRVNSWFSGIASGAAYLHDHGIVHRDLKPGNIFLDEGLVKIGDYGLSKFISVSRRSGQTESVGTFHYMAPEIGKGVYGKEIDIYALGVVLYEMLTGRVPFDGESSQEIIMKHLTDVPDLKGFPQPYSEVIAKALTKDPDNRYSSVINMLVDLGLERPSSVPAVAQLARSEESIESRQTVDQRREAHGLNLGKTQAAKSTGRLAATARHDRQPKQGGLRHIATPGKILLLILAVFLLVTNAGFFLPITVALVLIYLSYLAVRATVIGNHNHDDDRVGQLLPVTAPRPPKRTIRQRNRPVYRGWFERARLTLAEKSSRQRVTELVGSMLMSGLVSAVLGVVMLLAGNQDLDNTVDSWGPVYGWVMLTTILGSWAVLIPSKLWEGNSPDPSLQRFAMLVIGLLLGAGSFGIAEMLMMRHTFLLADVSKTTAVFSEMVYGADGRPQLLAYMGYFAGLFVVLRVWRQADPLRATRISLWATGMCVLWALVLHLFWPLPRGFMIAATISIAVQLSAPWMNNKQRGQLRDQAQSYS